MNESSSDPMVTVRVLQVGVSQITLSMYRQLDELDEATIERFEALGRVRDYKGIPKDAEEGLLELIGRDTETDAPVRYNAQPPRWTREGPSEYAHWLRHTEHSGPYSFPADPDGHRLVWTGKADAHCPERQTLTWGDEVFPGEHCTVDLVELEQAWRVKAEAELAELLSAQDKYDRLWALPLIVLPD